MMPMADELIWGGIFKILGPVVFPLSKLVKNGVQACRTRLCACQERNSYSVQEGVETSQ